MCPRLSHFEIQISWGSTVQRFLEVIRQQLVMVLASGGQRNIHVLMLFKTAHVASFSGSVNMLQIML